jgi:hypothetical protein
MFERGELIDLILWIAVPGREKVHVECCCFCLLCEHICIYFRFFQSVSWLVVPFSLAPSAIYLYDDEYAIHV